MDLISLRFPAGYTCTCAWICAFVCITVDLLLELWILRASLHAVLHKYGLRSLLQQTCCGKRRAMGGVLILTPLRLPLQLLRPTINCCTIGCLGSVLLLSSFVFCTIDFNSTIRCGWLHADSASFATFSKSCEHLISNFFNNSAHFPLL